jgi:TonB family protein
MNLRVLLLLVPLLAITDGCATADSADHCGPQAETPEGNTVFTTPPALRNRQAAVSEVSSAARERGLTPEDSGSPQVWLRVNKQGRVDNTKLASSSGDARVDSAALQAVRTWRFVPAHNERDPVCLWFKTNIPVRPDS